MSEKACDLIRTGKLAVGDMVAFQPFQSSSFAPGYIGIIISVDDEHGHAQAHVFVDGSVLYLYHTMVDVLSYIGDAI